ncbi:MAG: glycosyltransferase family 39 protein [Gaiellaceae bacterium]
MDGEVGEIRSEAESCELRLFWALKRAARARPTLTTIAALVGLATVSTLLRALLVGSVHGPFVFMDELGYERMAQNFAHTRHFALFGEAGLAYSPLYPIVLSPIYALTSSMHTAYEWAKVENAVLISLAVFPMYGIARFVLPRRRAVGVAALSLIAPLMLYSGFEMSESLAYPLALLAIWTMLRAVRRPSIANDAVLLAAVGVATATRIQLVAMVPSALTAILVVAVVRPEPQQGRARAAWRAVTRHRLLFGACGMALVAVLARKAINGGGLPLAGRYSNVGSAHASPWRVLELAVEHLAELDFAVGVIPFAAALLAGYALHRFGFPRNSLVFASVAVATTVWFLLEVGFDAAAFDATSAHPHPQTALTDLPRIHERYLIYLVPFFLVALVAALPLLRGKIPMSRHFAIAAAAAALPALIPFGTVINGTRGIDSFALQLFGTTKHGRGVPVTHATTSILLLAGLLAAVYLLAASLRLPPAAAVLVTGLAFLVLSMYELGTQLTPIPQKQLGLPSHNDWVDRVVGRGGDVSLVGGSAAQVPGVRETAFWNVSVTRVYYTCKRGFGTDFGEQPLTTPVVTRYAVVPTSLRVAGRVIARDPVGKLNLVAPAGDMLLASGMRCGS